MAEHRICAVEGCGKAAINIRGWCNAHYLRWRRHGDPKGKRTLNGEPLRYLLAHMWDECPKWPFYRNEHGYGEMSYRGRRGVGVHRIVCELAHGEPPTPEHEAAHSCGLGHLGCFGANCLSWKTRLGNVGDSIAHGTWVHGEGCPQHKLTEAEVRDIFGLKQPQRQWGYTGQIAARYGVSENAVREIWSGRTWAWLTGARASALSSGARRTSGPT